jgi:hypothetical protein
LHIDIFYNFNMTLPCFCSFQSVRAIFGESVPYRNCGRDVTYHCSMRSLTIENVTLEDRGSYTCQVTDHNKVTNKETKVIKVYGK